jgi:hypothetical protein
MKTLRARGSLAALALATLLLAGCSSDKSPTSPANPAAQDAADDVALQTVASLSLTASDLQVAVGTVPQGAARPTRVQWDTTFTQGGLTYVATRDFFDAGNNLLPGYDPTAVKMTWTSHVTGTVEFPRDTATVVHRATIDVHGIQAGQDTLHFDGGVFDTLTNRFRSYDGTRTRFGYWKSYVTIEDVRFLKSAIAAGLGFPIAGRVTFAVSLDRLRSNSITDVESHLDATVVVTFHGTALADIVVNGAWRYKWNLVSGQVTRA